MPDNYEVNLRVAFGRIKRHLQIPRRTYPKSTHNNRQYVDTRFNGFSFLRSVHPYTTNHAVTQKRAELGKALFGARLRCTLYEIGCSRDCSPQYSRCIW
jgi:hypothetical protein